MLFALNFYPELYADMLMRGRKSATIRLGDKSDKYRTGQIVWITVGRKYQVRQKLFSAIIDDVTVKKVGDLSMREVEKENLEFRNAEDVMTLLSRIYDRLVTPLEHVTIISFSPVREDGKEGFGRDLRALGVIRRLQRVAAHSIAQMAACHKQKSARQTRCNGISDMGYTLVRHSPRWMVYYLRHSKQAGAYFAPAFWLTG